MSTACPEQGPRRYLCRVVLPVAALTACSIFLLHSWVEADLQASLLLQASTLSATGVVEVGGMDANRGIDDLMVLAQRVRLRWTLLLVAIGAASAGLAGTHSLELTRLPRAYRPVTG